MPHYTGRRMNGNGEIGWKLKRRNRFAPANGNKIMLPTVDNESLCSSTPDHFPFLIATQAKSTNRAIKCWRRNKTETGEKISHETDFPSMLRLPFFGRFRVCVSDFSFRNTFAYGFHYFIFICPLDRELEYSKLAGRIMRAFDCITGRKRELKSEHSRGKIKMLLK